MDRLLERYGAYLLSMKRRSPLTHEAYVREAKALIMWLAEHSESPETVGARSLLEFLVFRKSSGLTGKTMARIVSSLHTFFKFLKMDGLRSDDPSASIETPRQEKTLPEALPP
jgi:integrase/recombinase XerD